MSWWDGPWYWIGVMGAAFLALFALADLLRYVTKRPEPGRKLAHVGTGLLALCFPAVFAESWPVYLLCGAFVVMLVASQRRGFWEGINGVERKTHGSVAFPLAVAALWWASGALHHPAVYALPLGVLTLADPAAALVGQNWPLRRFRVFSADRSVGGTAAFFVVALVASGLLSWLGLAPSATAGVTVAVALVTTVAETLSQRGWDNFWIPITGAAVVLLAGQHAWV